MSPIATTTTTQTATPKDKPTKAGCTPDEREETVLNTMRLLAADLCQQHNSGHPGTAMGAASIAVALYRHQMRYNPANTEWFARDRFVLSAGHASLLQYIILHLTGHAFWTLDVLKNYHGPVLHGPAAGHPEIEFPGIEVTTGPLGQGIANAVGLAMAGKQLGSLYNREGFPIIDGKVWCFTGDGCIQEGVGMEAISLAGHWGLDNLIMIYDQNNVTVDGTIDACLTDDTPAKLAAQGWHVISVGEVTNDVGRVVAALEKARGVQGKPVLVHVQTSIGAGSSKANTHLVHGSPLGVDNLAETKRALGFDSADKFVVPAQVYEYFSDVGPRGAAAESKWNDLFERYRQSYPVEYAELSRRLAGELREGWEADLPLKTELPSDIATRTASSLVIQALAPKDASWLTGPGDLASSCLVNYPGQVEFQNPITNLGDYTGRAVRWGVREHAMAAIANGIVAYHPGAFLPVISTFLMFFLYSSPANRMAALQRLRVVGLATHDSIGVGPLGPTHQPVAVAALFRAIPGMTFLRPADAEEVMGAYLVACGTSHAQRPSIISLSRNNLPLLQGTDRNKVKLGAYVVHGGDGAVVTLVSTGSEVSLAIQVADRLTGEGISTRVVSMPSQVHFDAQPEAYRRATLPTRDTLVVSIEAYVSTGWAKYAHAGAHLVGFAHAAPADLLYEYYGLGVDNLTRKIGDLYRQAKGSLPAAGEYVELLDGHVPNQYALAV
ncbi:Dihydroxyacetone synthase [Vanrija pseudolonga]|uniref:Dihydroxyacetone synthase n=1 Tax=Vanrija pseudolonga TaxID=143232 RepID=A0AAF1BQR2_9TREE|nr:Dihydroxyacetone synthase [Vanrija pseudolonga]